MKHDFRPDLLREYDIRGIIGRRWAPDDARAIGRGLATLLREAGGTTVAVGRDGRVSSPMLEHALVEGLTARAAATWCGSAWGRPRCSITPKPQMKRWMAASR
jgi:phosphomannomutase